jgi:hypothetical protein
VLSVQRGTEAVAVHQVPEAIAWLDECQMHAAIIELPFQSLEHFGGNDVDVSDHRALQNDPGRGRSHANFRTLSRN